MENNTSKWAGELAKLFNSKPPKETIMGEIEKVNSKYGFNGDPEKTEEL